MRDLWDVAGPGNQELTVPQDADAERSLVATLAGVEGTSREVLDLLEPSHFIDGRCGHIFGAIKTITEQGEEVSALSIKAELERCGTLGLVGGFINIVEFLNTTEVGRSLPLAERIHTLWRQRRLMEVCGRAMRQASLPENEAGEVIEQLQGDIQRLSGTRRTAPRFDRLNWAEVKDRPTPSREWLIEGLVPLGVPGMLVSKPGHGKTWLALQLAVASATGLTCMGLATSGPIGVVMIEMEDGRDRVEDRIKTIRKSYGSAWLPQHDDLLDKNLVMLFPAVPKALPRLSLSPDAGTDYRLVAIPGEIEAEARSIGAPLKLIVVDTLAAVSDGDENSLEAVRPIWAVAGQLSTYFGATTLFCHHYKKMGVGANAPTLEARLDPEVIRGSTGAVGSARFVLQFGWITEKEAEKVDLEAEGAQRRYAVLALTKDNDGPLSPWTLLEHSGTGPWEIHAKSTDLLAALRGASAQRVLAGQDQVLLALWRAHRDGREFDRKGTSQALFFSAKDPAASLRATLSNLKRAGLLGPDSKSLTPGGVKRAQRLEQEPASDDPPIMDESA